MVYAKLEKFLNDYPKKEKHTHTIYGGDIKTGAYTIPFDKTDEFHRLVAKSIHVKGDRISVVEKVQDISRFVIDLDLKWKDEITERQYNETVLMNIVNDIMCGLNTVYELSDEQKFCMVMEKEKFLPAKHKDYSSKDGIHLLFPYIIAEKKTYRTLREILLKTDYKKFFVDEGFVPPSNDMAEIIDENIYKGGNWFIYGSGKPNEITYKLTRIYKKSSDTLSRIPLDLYIDDKEALVKMNSVKMQDDINVVYTGNLKEKMSEGNLKKSMSVENIGSDGPINQHVVERAKTHDIEIAKKLAQILSVERASSYAEWLEVGYCLNSISQTLLPAWIVFSKKWSMFNNSDECEKQWTWFNRNNNDNYTIGSLHYWAKNDNLQEYKDIIRDSLSSIVHSSVGSSGSHADLANVIFHYFKDCFVCANIKDSSWFYFDENKGGKWEETEVGHELRSRLSNDIVDVYNYYGNIYKNRANDLILDDEDAAKLQSDKHTKCLEIQIKLKDSVYKDKVMKECKEKFYDKKFIDKLNDKKNLIGFDNGIYDLNKSIFRAGLPSDYVSLSTGYSLPVDVKNLPVDLEEITDLVNSMDGYQELNDALDDFLTKVFPIAGVREYTLRFLASCLSGEIREEKFYFWTGSGGNGKSKLVELIDFVLGDYSRSMDVSFLTTKRGSSSSASPELENIKSARFVYMSEPEKSDIVYVGKLKQMTGGDKMTTRALFRGTTQFKPQFKIVLMCNDLPQLGGNDGGIWRRIEVVKYLAIFTDNERSVNHDRYQYLADNQLTAKLEQWKLVFIVKLLQKYIEYDKEGTRPPDEVKDETKQYKTSNDIIANWVDDRIGECEEFSTFDELYDDWESYCDDEGINHKQRPEKKDIKVELMKMQDKTSYGLVIGKKKSDGAPNGTKQKPKFNFKVIDD
jgi:P4 family phage/plasmid primase-like protien